MHFTTTQDTHTHTSGISLVTFGFIADNKLYWVDAGTDMVEMSDLNGNGRTILLRVASTYHFFGLALFQDSLYITDWGSAG